jgi:hypothetical protein
VLQEDKMEDEKYLFLPSDSSSSYFPNNTTSNYITQLPEVLELSDDFTVGLVEISMEKTWKNIREDFTVGVLAQPIYPNDFPGYPVHTSIINLFNRSRAEQTITEQQLESVEDLVKLLNTTITDVFDNHDYFKVYQDAKPSIVYDKTSKLVTVNFGKIDINNVSKGVILKVFPYFISNSQDIYALLGLKIEEVQQKVIDLPTLFAKGVTEADLNRGQSYVHVYTDIISPQIVGDKLVPLLRAINTSNKKYGDLISICFNPPYYVPVSQNRIPSVEIKLTNEMGFQIRFGTGRVQTVLKLKRKSPFRL